MKRRIGSYFYSKRTSVAEISRRRWHMPTLIGKILKRTAMVLGSIMLFSIFLGILIGFVARGSVFKHLPGDMIVTLDIDEPVSESPLARSWADPLSSGGLTVQDFTTLFETAAKDNRVRGIVVQLNDAGIELAHLQELRAAVKNFRKSGKFAYIYTASFGDLGSGIGAYYLAAAFDQIWMQPVGLVTLTGIAIEMPFAKDVLDKLGAKAEFLHREEYKSAMESFTNTQMSPANREMTAALLNDFSKTIFDDILVDRKLKPAVLRSEMDSGLISGPDAIKAGLIDKVDHLDILMDGLSKKISEGTAGKKSETVDALDYLAAVQRPEPDLHAANVALVQIDGEIVPGNKPKPGYATGEYIADAIREAADQENIRAIVVRVNSPGGSPSASETIRRSIVYAKDKKKKVYVSMGPLAASGGYWLVVDADHIFALPTTITGSIGVIMGKFDISQTWKKIGVNWDSLQWGQNARLWSMNAPLDERGYAALNAAIDSTYSAFIDRVAIGRKMEKEKVHALAKGRAWSGVAGKKNGLVDEIGGLNDTLDYAAIQMGLRSHADLRVVTLPTPLSAFEEFMTLFGTNVLAGGIDFKTLSMFKPYMDKIQVMEKIGPVQAYDPSFEALRP